MIKGILGKKSIALLLMTSMLFSNSLTSVMAFPNDDVVDFDDIINPEDNFENNNKADNSNETSLDEVLQDYEEIEGSLNDNNIDIAKEDITFKTSDELQKYIDDYTNTELNIVLDDEYDFSKTIKISNTAISKIVVEAYIYDRNIDIPVIFECSSGKNVNILIDKLYIEESEKFTFIKATNSTKLSLNIDTIYIENSNNIIVFDNDSSSAYSYICINNINNYTSDIYGNDNILIKNNADVFPNIIVNTNIWMGEYNNSIVAMNSDAIIPTFVVSNGIRIENEGVNSKSYISTYINANGISLPHKFNYQSKLYYSEFVARINTPLGVYFSFPKSENHFVMKKGETKLDLYDAIFYDWLWPDTYDKNGNSVGTANIKWMSDNTSLATVDSDGLVTRVSPTSSGFVIITAIISAPAGEYLDENQGKKIYTITNKIELSANEKVTSDELLVEIISDTNKLDGYSKSGNEVQFGWSIQKKLIQSIEPAVFNNKYVLKDVKIEGDIANYFVAVPRGDSDVWEYAESFVLEPLADAEGNLLFAKDKKVNFTNSTVKFTFTNAANEDEMETSTIIENIAFKGKAPKLSFKGKWTLNSYFEPSIYQLASIKTKTYFYQDDFINHFVITAGKKKYALNSKNGYYPSNIVKSIKISADDNNKSSFLIKNRELYYNGSADKYSGKIKLKACLDGYYGMYDIYAKVNVSSKTPAFSTKKMQERIIGLDNYYQTVYANDYSIAKAINSIKVSTPNYPLVQDDDYFEYPSMGDKNMPCYDFEVWTEDGSKFLSDFNPTINITLDNVKQGKQNTFIIEQEIKHEDAAVEPYLLVKDVNSTKYKKTKNIILNANNRLYVEFVAPNNNKYKKITDVWIDKTGFSVSEYSDFGYIYYNDKYRNSVTCSAHVSPNISVGNYVFTIKYKMEVNGIESVQTITQNVTIVKRESFDVLDATETIDISGYVGDNSYLYYPSQKSYFKPVCKMAAYGDKTINSQWGYALNVNKVPSSFRHPKAWWIQGLYCSDKNFLVGINRSSGIVSVYPRSEKILDGTITAGSTHTVYLEYYDRIANRDTQKVTINIIGKPTKFKTEGAVDLFKNSPLTEDSFTISLAGNKKGTAALKLEDDGVYTRVYDQPYINEAGDQYFDSRMTLLEDFINQNVVNSITTYKINDSSECAKLFDLRLNESGDFLVGIKSTAVNNVKPGKYSMPVEIYTLLGGSKPSKFNISVTVH